MDAVIHNPPVNLPPNKTYKLRTAIFHRITDDSMVVGVVEVRERFMDRGLMETVKNTDDEVRRYAIAQHPGTACYRFTKPGGGEYYDVSLAGGCECRGFLRHNDCVHHQCVRALRDAGQLEPLSGEKPCPTAS